MLEIKHVLVREHNEISGRQFEVSLFFSRSVAHLELPCSPTTDAGYDRILVENVVVI